MDRVCYIVAGTWISHAKGVDEEGFVLVCHSVQVRLDGSLVCWLVRRRAAGYSLRSSVANQTQRGITVFSSIATHDNTIMLT